ncbi:hypothetical protein CLIB1423_35S00474 [[Candida] railenensis]|uniref:Uncharacterized protein n=1 Tax=[Candida] railenensis TaxID=45579 RepID=A0A9P0W1M6_9ASCO|nr:hypothetical protein CLIB1423_35S00474 [[Candida] railenensis]
MDFNGDEPELGLLNEIGLDHIDAIDDELGGVDILDRNSRLTRRLFVGIPPNERHLWLDMINQQLMRARRASSRDKKNKLFRIIWVYGNRIPLPHVNYRKLYRDLKVGECIRLLQSILFYTFDAFRKLLMYYLMFERVLPLIRMFLEISEVVTFSNSSFGQLLTFILEENHSIFDHRRRLAEMNCHNDQMNNYNVRSLLVEWILSDGWLTIARDVVDKQSKRTVKQHISIIQAFKETIYNSVTSGLQVTCISLMERDSCKSRCYIDENTLIFKFSNVLKNFFPIFSENHSWLLKLSTVVLWATYILGMYAISTGVLWNLIVSSARIGQRYIAFFMHFFKTLDSIGVF